MWNESLIGMKTIATKQKENEPTERFDQANKKYYFEGLLYKKKKEIKNKTEAILYTNRNSINDYE